MPLAKLSAAVDMFQLFSDVNSSVFDKQLKKKKSILF